jgi:magnesium-transporting ATPase (P-type)
MQCEPASRRAERTAKVRSAAARLPRRGRPQHTRRRSELPENLSSIEDFGSMDTLCVDNTGTLTLGTLTLGTVELDAALDIDGRPDSTVAEHAWHSLDASRQSRRA